MSAWPGRVGEEEALKRSFVDGRIEAMLDLTLRGLRAAVARRPSAGPPSSQAGRKSAAAIHQAEHGGGGA